VNVAANVDVVVVMLAAVALVEYMSLLFLVVEMEGGDAVVVVQAVFFFFFFFFLRTRCKLALSAILLFFCTSSDCTTPMVGTPTDIRALRACSLDSKLATFGSISGCGAEPIVVASLDAVASELPPANCAPSVVQSVSAVLPWPWTPLSEVGAAIIAVTLSGRVLGHALPTATLPLPA
jgi:hypothetical protein